jgi:hypothetical protein
LNNNPNQVQLRELLEGANDEACNHVLWIDISGNVHLTAVDGTFDSEQFTAKHTNVRIRFDEYLQGHGCVGQDAANDASHVDEVFGHLCEQWRVASASRTGVIIES